VEGGFVAENVKVLNLHYHQHGGAFQTCSRVECARAREGLPAFTLEAQDTATAPMALDAGVKAREIVRALAEGPEPVGEQGVCLLCVVVCDPGGQHDASCPWRLAREWMEMLG